MIYKMQRVLNLTLKDRKELENQNEKGISFWGEKWKK